MSSYNRHRVARNFIKNYGKVKYRRLIQGFVNNESGQVLADEFNVSRERIRQWKNTFGEVITIYRLHSDLPDPRHPTSFSNKRS